MPSGKHKSKEATWTEKDLTGALQGEKPRRSKDESRHRESKEEGAQKRQSRERGHEEGEKDRQKSKHEKSERHRETALLEPEEDTRRISRGKDDDREKVRRHRNREKLKDDIEESDESNDRKKEGRRKERHREDKSRTKDEYSRREDEENGRDKDRKRKSKEDRDRKGGGSRDQGSREASSRDHGSREGSSRDQGSREGSSRAHDGERERSRDRPDKGKEEKRKEKDEVERRTDKDKDERRRDKEKGETRKDKEKDERRREKEERHKDKERRGETAAVADDDRRSERRRDKERRNRTEEIEGGEEDNDRERERRRKKEERREKERSKDDGENESREKEKRKEKGDKERLEEVKDDRGKHREDREKRKQKQHVKDKDEQESERRHKERKDTEYENSVKKSKEKLEANGRSSPNLNELEVAEEIEDNYGEDNYEDDFEDYEDDFEDENDEEDVQNEHEKGKLVEIFNAINAENDDVRMSPFQKTDDSKEQEVKPINDFVKSSAHGRINFVAAKQKHVSQSVASKTKKRAQELHHLIELDVASYDIFDLPPLNEYELYIKSYGQSDSKQAYVQCHDDIIEKEIQTEEIGMSTKWTQNPPDDFKGCGEGDESKDKNDTTENTFSPHSVDSVKLSNFLQQAGQVCLILLEENIYGKTDSMFKERNDIHISDGFIQLATKLPFLEGRRVLDMNFNSIQTHLLLTAHDCDDGISNAAVSANLHGKGIVCFWNINEPTQPQKILFCESTPKSCCFSPFKSSLVFAGLEDGSIVIWDVRESPSLHSIVEYGERKWVVRRPTFSTAGVFYSENHLSPVQSILPISLPKESAEASIRSSFVQDDPIGLAFQLASLEENGFVHIWVVIELDKPDEAGSESDLGLAPGGRVKLIKSTSIQVTSPRREIFNGDSIQTSVMQFSTEDPNHFYVGTDRGWVVHCTRYGGRTKPKIYKPEIDSFVTVTAIDVSPWSIPIMLVGCADGTLRLHDLRKEHIIRSWTESTQRSSIVQVKWSRSRPSLFYVLDSKSNLYIWDLLQNDGCPISTECFKHGKLLFFSISNDYESLGIGLPGRKSELVLNYEGGIIELHRLKQTLTIVQADELDKFASLVDSFI